MNRMVSPARNVPCLNPMARATATAGSGLPRSTASRPSTRRVSASIGSPPPVQVEGLTYLLPEGGAHPSTPQSRGASAHREVRLEPPFAAPLRLPPESYEVNLEFAALSFTAPEKNRMQYLLEGHTKDWREAGPSRRAHFPRLPPGAYVLRVRAANNDGVWNEEGARFAFQVLPFLWQTAWFRLGTALLLVGSGVALTWRHSRRRVQRALERERAALEIRDLAGRLISAQEDERRRIARELHDDFSQSLALLSVEMDLFGAATPAVEPEAAHKLSGMAARVKDLSSEVHRMAHQLHPAKLDQLGLVPAARGFCRELSEKTGLRIDFEAGAFSRRVPDALALCLFRVLQESLHNVVRHSGAQSAQVVLREDPNRLRLTATDSGRGFDGERAQREGGLGLSSMRERVRLLHGALQVSSSPGQGTRIELSLPWSAGGEL